MTVPEAGGGICALLLAAGQGSRFRAERDEDKLIASLPLHGQTMPVLGHVIRALAGLIEQGLIERSLIVTHEDNHALQLWLAQQALPPGCRPLRVRSGGLGESLAAAASGFEPAGGYLVMLGDMPFVKAATLVSVLQRLRPDRLVMPCYRGQPGHPRGIGRDYRSHLLNAQGDKGLGELFATDLTTRVEVNDPGVLLDIDRPEDLAGLSRSGTFAGEGKSYP